MGEASQVALSTVLGGVGRGIYATAGVLFFSQVLGLGPAEIAGGLTAAGLVGIVVGFPAGWLADRVRATWLLAAFLLVEGVLVAGLVLVSGRVWFLVAVCAVALAERGGSAVRGGVIASVAAGSDRGVVRSQLHAVGAVGMAMGSGIGALGLAINTDTAYHVLIVGAGAAIAASSIPIMVMRAQTVRASRGGPAKRSVLTDLPYMAVTVLRGILFVHRGVLTIGLPLWVVGASALPEWTVAVAIGANTVCVSVLQARFSSMVKTLRRAKSVTWWASLALMVAMVVYGFAGTGSVAVSAVLLALGVIIHTAATLGQNASAFLIGFELAPESAQGAYQGVYSTGMAASQMVAPGMIVGVLGLGIGGWVLLGAVFVVAGGLSVGGVGWAQRKNS